MTDLAVGNIVDFRYVSQANKNHRWSEILIEETTPTGFTFMFLGEPEDHFKAIQGADGIYRAYGSEVMFRPAERWPSRLLEELGVGSEAWIKTTLGSI